MDDFDDFVTASPAPTQPQGTTPADFDPDTAMNQFLQEEQQVLGTDVPFDEPQTNQQPNSQQQQQQQSSQDFFANGDAPVQKMTQMTVSSTTPSATKQESNFGQTETQPMKEAREKREKKMKEQEEVSKKLQQQQLEKAKKEIDQFYADYQLKKQKRQEKNREDEKTFKDLNQASTQSSKGENIWEKVLNRIDSSSTSNTTSSVVGKKKEKDVKEKEKEKRDMSRYKNLLVQLKNDPNAPGNEIKA